MKTWTLRPDNQTHGEHYASHNHWTQWTEAEGPLVRLAFFRIVVGFMLWRHIWVFVRKYLTDGFYRDKFYLPYWEWYPLPSEMVYLIVMGLMMMAGFFIIIGYKTRIALIVALTAGGFHLFLNQFWYGYNRYFMLLALLLLCVSPCERVLALDTEKQNRTAKGPTWLFLIIRLQMTLIYFASALAKTLDPDWRSGRVLWDRGLNVAVAELRVMKDVPQLLVTVLSNRTFLSMMTIAALSQEYFLAFGLWLPWTRRLAIWVGLVFHGCIEIFDAVLAFSYLSLGTYFLVISPQKQNRTFYYNPHDARHQFWARWIHRLDWFDKIRLVADELPLPRLQDAEGQWYQGWMAIATASSALVLPYLVAYPLTWLRFFSVGRIQTEAGPTGKIESFQSFMGPAKARFLLLVLLLAYLAFLSIVTTVPAFHMEIHGVKFVDGLLIFVIFALMITAYPK